MEIEDDPPMSIPEWVVTFGDMMSLLLTFFIMLVSLSEIKQDEKLQAIMESFHRQFGPVRSSELYTPGDRPPHPTARAVLATEGRARQKNIAKGGVPKQGPEGEEPHVRIIRPGQHTAVGSVIFFRMGEETLDDKAKKILGALAEQLRGKAQRIEIRGHAEPQIAARATELGQPMDLSYGRSRVVMRYLVETEKIEPNRIRISASAGNEPMDEGSKLHDRQLSGRVEVFLLDESLPNSNRTPAADNSNVDAREPSDG